MARIVFLLGKPVREGTVFPAVLARLRAAGLAVEVRLPHGDPGFAAGLSTEAALIVHRGLRADVLAMLEPLEQAGLRCCNRIRASRLVLDRARLGLRLAEAGLPVPWRASAADWATARRLARGRDVVVKAMDGGSGRGAGVVMVRGGDWPAAGPFAGPLLVEALIQGDGIDRKLYVAGKTCRGLLKPWPRDAATPALPFVPDAGLERLALAVGRALELDLFGVDVVLGPTGPAIVDVNLFPGFKGIPDAAAAIADHLRHIGAPGG